LNIYDFKAMDIDGKERELKEFSGKVLLIVNTASKCGFTPQYKGLETLYERMKDDGLEILGFPCGQFKNQELDDSESIKNFCELNYGVSFPMFSKIDVNGENAHPLFVYLRKETKGLLVDAVKWNFTKFLVDRNGTVIRRYAPQVDPLDIEKDIRSLL
jgi:glutathione peroxidase